MGKLVINLRTRLGDAEGIALRIKVGDAFTLADNPDFTTRGDHLGRWVGSEDRAPGEQVSWVNVLGPRGWIAAYALHRGRLCQALPCYSPWPDLDRIVAAELGAGVVEAEFDAGGMGREK